MHYIHRLNPIQKRVLIFLFVLLPVIFVAMVLGFWAYNRGLLTESFELKSIFKTAAGLDVQTSVSFSGIKIGRVTGVRLNDADLIEVTMTIEEEYRRRIHKDAVAMLAALSFIGQKEVEIEGGSADMPIVSDGDFIKSGEMLEVKNLIDKVRPLIESGRVAVAKLEEVINSFPNEKMNQAVVDLALVIENIKEGRASFGKMVSTDKNRLFNNADALMKQLNTIAKRIEQASEHFPETSREVKASMTHMAKILERAETASSVLEKVPEMEKKLAAILDSMKNSFSDLEEMAPVIKKIAKDVSKTAEEFAGSAPQIPRIMDDLELALSESLLVIQSVKSSWPVNNMVPEKEEIPVFEPSQRESPYMAPEK